MLLPHAALHQTISSVSGSNSVKQMGQSPDTSLRLLGCSEEASEAWDEGRGGAWEKISRSSCVWRLLVDENGIEVAR